MDFSALDELKDVGCEQVMVVSDDNKTLLYSLVPPSPAFTGLNLDWKEAETLSSIVLNDQKYFIVHKDAEAGHIKAKKGPLIVVCYRLGKVKATAMFFESKDREPIINVPFERICHQWV
jgi:hypothetical protein